MKVKTLPNGNMNLEGIGFISQTVFHCKIGEFVQRSTPCHYVSWTDVEGEFQRHALEYDSIVDCFRKKIWRVKLPITPVKILTNNYKFV